MDASKGWPRNTIACIANPKGSLFCRRGRHYEVAAIIAQLDNEK